jgi:ornithine--oxo-acid transaminase
MLKPEILGVKIMTSQELKECESEWGAHNYHPLPVVISRAEGVWVWDVEGNKYIDMLSSYSAINQGHLHPYIISKVNEQLNKLTLTSRAFYNDRLGPFLKHLCEFANMEMALPMNTGAEAVETAIKLARKWSYENRNIPSGQGEIIVCENNFHGRTTTIVGFSSDSGSKDGFGPFTPGFVTIPFNDIESFKNAINDKTIGILLEPIQAEAGIYLPDDGYLKGLREICDERELLLILDEIQTGLGRTGKMFAFQHENIQPDILCVGKALGGGVMPVSAVLSSRNIMSAFTPGTHGSTFGGNPLACAAGDAALDILVNEELDRNSTNLGKYFIEQLNGIKSDKIKEVRGKGLLIGVEINLKPDETVRPLCEELMKQGVLAKDTHERTIRFAPPLTITKDEIDWALERIRKVLE